MLLQVLPLIAVVAVVGLAAIWFRRRNGTVGSTTATFSQQELRSLGVPARRSALVLFTAPGCAPCGPAKRVLQEFATSAAMPLIVASVTEHHDLASSQHVYRAPTTFVIDEFGRALGRISGIPRVEELTALLDRHNALAA